MIMPPIYLVNNSTQLSWTEEIIFWHVLLFHCWICRFKLAGKKKLKMQHLFSPFQCLWSFGSCRWNSVAASGQTDHWSCTGTCDVPAWAAGAFYNMQANEMVPHQYRNHQWTSLVLIRILLLVWWMWFLSLILHLTYKKASWVTWNKWWEMAPASLSAWHNWSCRRPVSGTDFCAICEINVYVLIVGRGSCPLLIIFLPSRPGQPSAGEPLPNGPDPDPGFILLQGFFFFFSNSHLITFSLFIKRWNYNSLLWIRFYL